MVLMIDPGYIHIHDLAAIQKRENYRDQYLVEVLNTNGVHYIANGIIVDYNVLRQEIAQVINRALIENVVPAGLLHGVIPNKDYITHNISSIDRDIFSAAGINPIRRRDDDTICLWGDLFIFEQKIYSINRVHPIFKTFCIVEEAKDLPENLSPPTVTEVGEFIDAKTAGHPRRTPQAVAGRVLEELVELCLILGMPPGNIFDHIADALANQALKSSQQSGHTIFPSQLTTQVINPDRSIHDIEIAGEIADVRMTLKDLVYNLGYAPEVMDQAEAIKWQAFISKEFRVSDQGCLYSKKPHITG